MPEILRIQQLDPGDENCENYAFIPYEHQTPKGTVHTPSPTALIRLNQTIYKQGFAEWTCDCGTILEFMIPVDSDLE